MILGAPSRLCDLGAASNYYQEQSGIVPTKTVERVSESKSIRCIPRATPAEYRFSQRRGGLAFPLSVLIALDLLSIFMLVVQGFALTPAGILSGSLGAVLLGGFVLPQRAAERTRDLEWTFGPEKLEMHLGSAYSAVAWPQFSKMIIQSRVILFVIPGAIKMIMVPRRCLTLDETEQVVAWAAAKGVRVVLSDP